jgi:hypothetical protein
MGILSFDVGIKNLAFCYVEVTDISTIKSLDILDWQVIDVTNEVKHICEIKKKKSNSLCGNIASFKDNKNTHYCKRHAKLSEFILPKSDLTITKIKRKNIKELKELAKEYHIEYANSIKKTELLELIEKFLKHKFLSSIPKKCSQTDLVSLCISMTQIFNNIFKDKKIETVLIENQIGNKAIKMKSIQGMITQYFVSRGIHDIQYISSYNKLKFFSSPKKQLNYKERKKMAVDITTKECKEKKNLVKWHDFFIHHKKKDDLADAYLQLLWYVKQQKYCM